MAEDEQAAMSKEFREEKTRPDATLRFALGATRRFVCARNPHWGTRAHRTLLVLLAFTLAACDLGGGGGGSAPVAASSGTPVAAATVIDLPAGQQTATLAWVPSEGYVANYLVYESRNGGDYEFTGSVNSTQTTITGVGGEGVRVAVLAVNFNGTSSQASVPSPEIRFHDAPAAVAAGPAMPAAPTPTAVMPTDPASEMVVAAQTVAANESSASPVEAVAASDGSDTQDESGRTKISDSLRSLLLAGDTRLPAAGLAVEADAWLQARVEEEFSAGVRLVGTGTRDQDGLRELVWQDSAGQLLVSSGAAVDQLAQTADIPTTFEEAIRLGATERYVALADFNGDAVGDWVVEDSATGAVWIIDGVTLESGDARGVSEDLGMTLAGYGDFDGDNRQEFVWQSSEGRVHLGHPSGAVPSIAGSASLSIEAGGRLLTVADLDGNGRDDIIALDAHGQIRVSQVRSDATSGLYFDTHAGTNNATEGLQVVATIDHDEDGRSELIWLNSDEIEAWDAETGPEAF